MNDLRVSDMPEDDDSKHGGDRVRWGDRGNYRAAWATRSEVAATLVPDGASILEIGVGLGAFRALVAERCDYLGADLVPLDDRTLAIDLELDPLPPGCFDVVVLLGVLEYLRAPDAALAKIFASGRSVLLSYCHVPGEATEDIVAIRRTRGWLNDLSRRDLLAIAERRGARLRSETPVNDASDFMQSIFLFERAP
jgi:SAM-dependent methyltransferase